MRSTFTVIKFFVFSHICKSLHFLRPSVHFLFPRDTEQSLIPGSLFFPFFLFKKILFYSYSKKKKKKKPSWKSPEPNSIPSEVIATYSSYIPTRFSSLHFHVPVLINTAPDFTHAGITISVNLPSVIILIRT